MQELIAQSAQSELLTQAQRYLTRGERDLPPEQDLEAAWMVFFNFYTQKIRKYAFTCGATEVDIADCVQEVWTELLVRLPTFQFDPRRGKFDSWIFRIVRSKTVDLHRSHKRRFLQNNSSTLLSVIDSHPSPDHNLEEGEMYALAWEQLRQRLSECNLQILRMRLVDERSVAEVAEELGLSHEQVWYRYHRARREVEEIGLALALGPRPRHSMDNLSCEKIKKSKDSAQGKAASSVSRDASVSA